MTYTTKIYISLKVKRIYCLYFPNEVRIGFQDKCIMNKNREMCNYLI